MSLNGILKMSKTRFIGAGKSRHVYHRGRSAARGVEVIGTVPYCTGYVAGVVAGSDQDGITFCFASGVTSDQLADVVKLWLRDHPEKRHLSGSFLVFSALKEKFPCN
jgi:hypothetical protein